MFDVLIYLLESYLQIGLEEKPSTDHDKLTIKLREAGFEQAMITRALHWLNGITHADMVQLTNQAANVNSMRYYIPEEIQKLSVAARGLLLSLEQMGILTAAMRELAIERAMALEDNHISQAKMQWIVMVILFSHSEQQAAWAWIENVILNNTDDVLH